METPPPYAAPPAKKSRVGLIIGIIVGILALCCVVPIGLLGIFGKGAVEKSFGMIGCGISVDEYRSALLDYAKANDGKLPKADTWQDDLKPFMKKIIAERQKDSEIMKLPTLESGSCDSEAKTGIAYNVDVAGKKIADVKDPRDAVVLFEVVKEGRNLHEKFKDRGTENAPKLFGSVQRGWVLVTLEGDPVMRDGKGMEQPIQIRNIRKRDRGTTTSKE